MATKRPAPEASGAPPAKKASLVFSPLDIGPAGGEEDLNIKVLQVQNRKLSERLRERNRGHEEMERRVERMEEERDNHCKMMSSLKNHVSSLKTHVSLALSSLGEEEEGEHDEDGGEGHPVDSLEEMDHVFEGLFSSLVKLGQIGGKKLLEEIQGQDGEGEKLSHLHDNQSRVLSQLEELAGQTSGSEVRRLQNAVSALETKCEELENSLGEARFDLQKSQTRGDRMESKLQEALKNLQMMPALQTMPSEESSEEGSTSSLAGGAGPAPSNDDKTMNAEEVEQLTSDLAESQALAETRLQEIADQSNEITELKKEINQIKMDSQKVPESLVLESPAYKMLQSHYTIAVQEAGQVRACLEEAKQMLVSAKQTHFIQLEEIRSEEMKYQMEVREEMSKMENALMVAKRDYEMLRIDFERTMASNEQAAPIAKELQVTVDSLQKTIQQLKSEATRYKNRAHKAEQQLTKLQEDKDQSDAASSVSVTSKDTQPPSGSEDEKSVKSADHVERSEFDELNKKLLKVSEEKSVMEGKLESLRQASSREEREKAEIIAAEKKARSQVEDLKRKFEEYRKDYEKRKEHIKEEANRKSKSLTEDNKHLQKDLAAKKQEAQALVSEMECTAQAFEEMQEQNVRLLQQLKEKDDANFKLMSERIKSNSVQKLLLEEKELLKNQMAAMATETQRLGDLIAQLEERERNSEAALQSVDKELTLKQQAIELHKKKALESVQSLQETQLKMEEIEKTAESTEKTLQEKIEECERESQAVKRVQEEVGGLKKKLEKYKSREWMASSDEVLLEEIKTYKAKLNCPCCSTRKKDTVLTKCFHVFCSECIRNRYDSRLRKCPKCGAAFGANDFHKLYLS